MKVGLARQPTEAKAFYITLAIANACGHHSNLLNINPIKALYWSAIINGVVAVPVIACMMVMTADRRIMGQFTIGGPCGFSDGSPRWPWPRRRRHGSDGVVMANVR